MYCNYIQSFTFTPSVKHVAGQSSQFCAQPGDLRLRCRQSVISMISVEGISNYPLLSIKSLALGRNISAYSLGTCPCEWPLLHRLTQISHSVIICDSSIAHHMPSDFPNPLKPKFRLGLPCSDLSSSPWTWPCSSIHGKTLLGRALMNSDELGAGFTGGAIYKYGTSGTDLESFTENRHANHHSN